MLVYDTVVGVKQNHDPADTYPSGLTKYCLQQYFHAIQIHGYTKMIVLIYPESLGSIDPNVLQGAYWGRPTPFLLFLFLFLFFGLGVETQVTPFSIDDDTYIHTFQKLCNQPDRVFAA